MIRSRPVIGRARTAHQHGEHGSDPEERGQGDRFLEGAAAEGGEPVADLVGGDQPAGGQLDHAGERRLAVPDRHREEAGAGETGEGEHGDPQACAVRSRSDEQGHGDRPGQHDVDAGRADALRHEGDDEPPCGDRRPEGGERIRRRGGCDRHRRRAGWCPSSRTSSRPLRRRRGRRRRARSDAGSVAALGHRRRAVRRRAAGRASRPARQPGRSR